MDHLVLFHHFSTETVISLGNRTPELEPSIQMILRYALSTPYLMHEALAISALHISILNLQQQASRKQQAIELQNRAIALFNETRPEVDAQSCVPMFLFSSFLGIHTLCDTLRYREEENLNTFLDAFTNYLNLHRGVRSITNKSWHLLLQTELAPWLKSSEAMEKATAGSGSECEALRLMIQSSDIGATSKETYGEAVDHLQSLFDSQRRTEDGAQLVFAWPIVIPSEYTNLISQRQPEALVILAHYAVLLHMNRWLWLIGDGGQFLIRAITKTLGHHWNDWLAWPNSWLESNA